MRGFEMRVVDDDDVRDRSTLRAFMLEWRELRGEETDAGKGGMVQADGEGLRWKTESGVYKDMDGRLF